MLIFLVFYTVKQSPKVFYVGQLQLQVLSLVDGHRSPGTIISESKRKDVSFNAELARTKSLTGMWWRQSDRIAIVHKVFYSHIMIVFH